MKNNNKDKLERLAEAFAVDFKAEEKALIQQNLNSLKEGGKIALRTSENAEKAAFITAALFRGKAIVFCSGGESMKAKIKALQKLHLNACEYKPEKVETNKFLFAPACAVNRIDFSPFKLVVCFDTALYSFNAEQTDRLKSAILCSGLPCLSVAEKAEPLPDNYLFFKTVPNVPTLKGYLKEFIKQQAAEPEGAAAGAVLCGSALTAEKVYKFLTDAKTDAALCTSESTGKTAKGNKILVGTSALLFNGDPNKFKFSFFYLLPLNLRVFEAVLRKTAGPVIVVCPSAYIDRQRFSLCSPQKALLLRILQGNDCIRKELAEEGLSSGSLYDLNGSLLCLNCSSCFQQASFACIYAKLDKWREKQALKESLPPVLILSGEQLKDIARTRPKSIRELKAIKGIKTAKAAKYGTAILRIIKSFEL